MNNFKSLKKKIFSYVLTTAGMCLAFPTAAFGATDVYSPKERDPILAFENYNLLIESHDSGEMDGKDGGKFLLGWARKGTHIDDVYDYDQKLELNGSESWLRDDSYYEGAMRASGQVRFSELSNQTINVYAHGAPSYDKDDGYTDTDFDVAAYVTGVKKTAQNNFLDMGASSEYRSGKYYDEPSRYTFTVQSGSPKIYPDSYEDVIVYTEDELYAIFPYLKDIDGYMSTSKKREIFKQYEGTKYFNKDWLNAQLGKEYYTKDITSYRNVPTSLSRYTNHTVLLEDNIATTIPYDAVKDKVGSNWENGDLSDFFKTNNYLVSNWEISLDNKKYYPIGTARSQQVLYRDEKLEEETSISADYVSYNSETKEISFATSIEANGDVNYTKVNVEDILGETNSFYIRRRSSATQVLATYNNVTSPPRRIRPTLTIDKIEAVYVGEAITQGLYADPKDVEFRVWYSDRPTYDSYTTYRGNQPFIEIDPMEVYNVGNNNWADWTFTDPRMGAVYNGEVRFPGKEPLPISLSASYQGDPVIEESDYNPTQIRVQVTYNNGSISSYNANSLSVGITTTDKYVRSDVDINSIVNKNDLVYLERALNGETLSESQLKQADINGDGDITNEDYDSLAELTDRNVPLGDRIFYASYARLYSDAEKKIPLFASFRIPSERKSPYKLIIATKPLKTEYIEGEDFDPTGMILNVFYNNGSSQIITFTDKDMEVSGLAIGDKENPSKNMSTDQTSLPIYYTENGVTVEAELNLSVVQKTLTSIKITTPPEVTTYYSGENFDRTGMEVTAYYDELRTNHQPTSVILNERDYDIDGEKRLPDSTDYILIEADDPTSVDTGYLRLMKNKVISPRTFENGTHATFTYNNGGGEKSITGTIVGNNYVTVSYTDRGVTKTDIQPLDVLKRKLVKVDIEQMPYKTEYTAGDSFETTGLILKATYTDGTSDYIYSKTRDRNGYTVVNPDDLQPDRIEVVVEYEEDGFMKDTTVPIKVKNPELESLTAVYIGPNVYVNTDFDTHNVVITAKYTNGKADAFRGDDVNIDGTIKFRFKNEAGVESTQVSKIGDNKFSVDYSGLTAEFNVKGIRRPDQIDFSGSVAKSKRKWAQWEEEFRAVKIKSVADYINGAVNDLNTGTITPDEYHVVEKTSLTENRDVLVDYNGTAKIPDFTDPNKVVSPLLSFMREGTWRQPETEISVEYKSRTKGFLFPEVVNPMFASDRSYLDKYYQNRDDVWAGDQGWSDWYRNGDSAGTVYADRVAYRYTGPDSSTDSEIMYLDALKIRLTGVRDGDNPGLKVTVQDKNGAVHTYNGITENDTILAPAKIKIELTGQITVTDDNSNPAKRNFADVYQIYYRTTTDELVNWSEAGEWAGTDGIQMQSLEIRLMRKDAAFDKGSISERPVFSQHPKNTTAIIGDRVIFQVSAVGQTITYQWYKDDVAIPGATSASYRTPELTAEDNGSHYHCVINNGMYETASVKALLKVNDIFPIITKHPSDVEGEVGSNQTFSVEATCKQPDTLHYTWEIRNGATWELLPGTQDTPDLTIALTEAMHGKDIRCKVENSRGYSYSNAARVNCSQPPEISVRSNTDYVIQGRQNIKFTAEVTTAAANATYQWLVDDIMQNESSSVFVFKPEKAGDHTIRCIITDKYGTAEDSKVIHVGNIPEVTISETQEKNTDGTYSVIFKAEAKVSGNGGDVSYEWRLDGEKTEEKTDTFRIDNLEAGDQFSVVGTVKDNFGSASDIRNVIIKEIVDETKPEESAPEETVPEETAPDETETDNTETP